MKKWAIALLALLIASPLGAEEKYNTGGTAGTFPIPIAPGQIIISTQNGYDWVTLGGGNGNCYISVNGPGSASLMCPNFGSGGGGANIPPGGPPQIMGWSTTDQLEAETSVGDVTFLRTGANTYTATVVAISSVLPSLQVTGPVAINGPLSVTGNTIVNGITGTVANFTNQTISGVLNFGPSGALYFNGNPMGGTCPNGEFVNVINNRGVPTCAPVSGGAPLVNPPGGQNNYAPIDSPNFTGTVTINGNPISGGAFVSETPPINPVIGQIWFNPIDLQSYIWYTDPTSSQWVPIVNLGGGNGGGGVVPPGTTIDSPVFIGVLQFPDGSYYDSNGHEVMKNLGVGMVANVDGVGGVYGNSIAVVNSGWVPAVGTWPTNAWWDSTGIEQIYDVTAQYVSLPVPEPGYPAPGDLEMLVQTNPDDATNDYPWGQYTLQNVGAAQSPDSGNTQTWQAEGLEFINSIGIHGDTWGTSIPGCNIADINGSWLGDCAIAAEASSLRNNLNYKIQLVNFSSGTLAQASYMLRNTSHVAGMSLTGNGFTPTIAGTQPDQLIIATDAPNGIVVAPSLTSGTFFNSPTSATNGVLTTVGNFNGSINVYVQNLDTTGTDTQAAFGANAGGTGNNLWMAQTGASATPNNFPGGSGFIYDDSALYLIAGWRNPTLGIMTSDGTNNHLVANFNSTGLNVIGNGTLGALAVNNNPVITNQVAFGAYIAGQAGGNCTPSTNNGIASRVGNHVTVQLNYVGTCTAMGGWLQISGFPWRNTQNSYASCALEVGGFGFDLNYWMATCRMLPGWDGCIPVEIGSAVPAAYYNSALIPEGQPMSLNMNCNYLVDSMSP